MRPSTPYASVEAVGDIQSAGSAVSWPAIIAGAVAAAAVSLILVALGAGIGFSTVSPWRNEGASATSLAVGTAIWMIVVQWVASGMGGYLTGRLRSRWIGTHHDEVFFRDTAHGFLAWALATVLTAMLLTSAVSSVVSGGVQAASKVAAGAAQGATQGAAQAAGAADPTAYLVDTLYRSDRPATNENGDVRGETTRILLNSMRNGSMTPADRSYLAQLVAARTGLSQQDAEKRVDDVVAQAKAAETKARAAADEARKASAKLAFYTFFSLLIGAFIASAAAALGGRQRDEW